MRTGAVFQRQSERGSVDMSELCRFAGMIIYMMFFDTGRHNKPHVNVCCGEYEAVIAIAGSLPSKYMKIITGWLSLHEEEAYKAWNLAVHGKHFDKIAPMI